ncbi:MAG: nuclear transport factor 2 family protein [Cyclobacteriaceae bacterium]|jgi:ketosteroid isomerase-like protein|nr:nuclear transport factor 2 family protein [Cyclobacteriaceae bacterium]
METHQLIEKFYTAFQQKDAASMLACYHPDVIFKDPVFGELNADDTKAMWRMLIQRGKDLKLTFTILQTTNSQATANWQATYTFSLTGRKIENHIHAAFILKDGLLYRHTDTFNVNKWLYMAFGFKGLLIAYMPPLKKKFKSGIKKTLQQYKNNNHF